MTSHALRPLLFALAVLIGAAGYWLGARSRQADAVATCAEGRATMVRLELAFGLSRKGRPAIDETAWQAFLAREITPRFPDGLTVLSAKGQWRNRNGEVISEPTRLLLVWTPAAPDLAQRIAAIRSAWTSTHDQESVLEARGPACVSF